MSKANSLETQRSHIASLAVFRYAQIDSTNSEAERLLATGEEPPFVVLAERQTQGRGRCGRRWESGCKGNLYASFAFRPRCSLNELRLFTLWIGAYLCDFFNTQLQAPIRIKWPNDLLYSGRKVGGMLTETRLEGDALCYLIFGLGLNINDDLGVVAPELDGVAACLAEAVGGPLPFADMTEVVVEVVLQAYTAFMETEYATAFWKLWPCYDALKGQAAVGIRDGSGQRLCGTVEGLTEDGALRLRGSDGKLRVVHAGEVMFSRL